MTAREHLYRIALVMAALTLAVACEGGGGQKDLQRPIDGYDRGLPGEDPDLGPQADGGVDAPEGPSINSIIPSRGPLAGGGQVRIIGQRFVEGTTVQIGAAACGDPVIESENHILCTVPPVEVPGPVSVFVRWPVGGEPARAEDAYTYFENLEVDQLSPDRAPASGGVQVSIEGRGFADPTLVRFGATPALSVTVVDDTRLIAMAPPQIPGVYDVTISNTNGQIVLPEAFSYTEALTVQHIRPRWGFLDGGDEITLQGAGLTERSEVEIGDLPAGVIEGDEGRTRLRVITPARAAPGPVTVEVSNVNGAWSQPEAFFYVDGAQGDFEITGVIPERLPTFGGDVWVIGGGFTEGAEVRIDGQITPCTLEAPQVLACAAGPHPEGAADVAVTVGEATVTRPEAIRFYTQVQIFNVEPPRGAVAGGSVVEVIGAGFTEQTALTLDGAPMRIVERTDQGRLLAVVPPGQPGTVDLVATNPASEALLQEAYEYFNPTSRFGGVWGEVIEHSVNFTLLDYYTGEPIEGGLVIGEPFEVSQGPALSAVTDANGQATLSQWGLRGPIMATGAAAGYEVNTYDRITTENVTMYLRPFTPPEGEAGNPPEPIPPSQITGRVTGLSALEKPLDESLILIAFVDTTHTAQGNRLFLGSPRPNGILFEDGDFHITTRSGQLAVVVTAGYLTRSALRSYNDGLVDYWGLRGSFTPVAMGFQRFLSLSPGEVAEGIQIQLDVPCDVEAPITLGNPPGGEPGAPEIYSAQPYLDLGSEGFWQLDTGAEGRSPLMLVPYMPALEALDDDIDVVWLSEARLPERDAEGEPLSRYPYAVALETARDYEAGVEIGPFVGTPVPTLPAPDVPLGPGRTFRWRFQDGVEGPTEPADATVVRVLNQNGRTVWTFVTPGPITEITLPELPLALGEIGLSGEGPMFLSIVPFISEGRFGYDEFTYNELVGAFQTSYSVYTLTFDREAQDPLPEQ